MKKEMENKNKIIAVLLILAILFSVVSVLVSFGALNLKLPEHSPRANVVSGNDAGKIDLFVEGNNVGGNG